MLVPVYSRRLEKVAKPIHGQLGVLQQVQLKHILRLR